MYCPQDTKVFKTDFRRTVRLTQPEQPDDKLSILKQYTLEDTVNALKSDAIFPPTEESKPIKIRYPELIKNTCFTGALTEISEILNPKMLTKFETLAESMQETIYKSHWKNPLGRSSYPIASLDYNPCGKTCGVRSGDTEDTYDIIYPKNPIPAPMHTDAGFRKSRNYVNFNPNLRYGRQTKHDNNGGCTKKCLYEGNKYNHVNKVISSKQADSKIMKQARDVCDASEPLTSAIDLRTSENIHQVFSSSMPSGTSHLRTNLAEVHSIRRKIANRRPQVKMNYFLDLYLNLKYLDDDKSGWLPKAVVYNILRKKNIMIQPELVDPALAAWDILKDEKINYQMFSDVLNFRKSLPSFPFDINKIKEPCKYITTYSDAYSTYYDPDPSPRAGINYNRYIDRDVPSKHLEDLTEANFVDEGGAYPLIIPSILTQFGITHRDMFAKREPDEIRRVFENAGYIFTDEIFSGLWEKAAKLHSQGWVCYDTFRKVADCTCKE